jgi:hypothetical protein
MDKKPIPEMEDITDQRRMETYREMGREVLQLLNDQGDFDWIDVYGRVALTGKQIRFEQF